MDQSNHPTAINMPLERLVSSALAQLERLGYSRRSLNRYRAIWTHLIEFSRRQNLENEFSEILAERFLDEYRIYDRQPVEPIEGWRWHIVFGIKVLRDFAQQGHVKRAVTNVERINLLPAMDKSLRDYEQYCKEKLYLRSSTLRGRVRGLTIFLDFLGSKKAKTLDQIQAMDLCEFVSSRDNLKPTTVAGIISDLRSFLRFLTMSGILQKDLSHELPIIRVPKDAHIPSVWDHELIVKLLGAVDRSSAKGKRDYAILLLACRLGLRVGDIRTLKLDNLNWDGATIGITQSKTSTPLTLPLTEEVGEALIDYLKSGRPKTTYREVFLKLNPPFEPFGESNLYHIVTYWRRLAGISFRSQQHRGLHSLRHTLATQLLQQETPLHTIGEILGHVTLESTRIYAKTNVEALRSVALDPEEVSDEN
jgi:site-specific recombinase XerD